MSTAFAPPGAAQAAGAGGSITPIRDCADLVGDFALPSGGAHVTAATPVPATADDPAHCDVRGHVDPAVRFQLRLPTDTFTGRYLQYGCGGFCGLLEAPASGTARPTPRSHPRPGAAAPPPE